MTTGQVPEEVYLYDLRKKAAVIYAAICECFNEENGTGCHFELTDIDNDFFEGSVVALHMLYQKVTGDEQHDIFDFVAMLNKVIMQNYMQRNGCKLEEATHD